MKRNGLPVAVVLVLLWLVGYPLLLNTIEAFRSADAGFTFRFFSDFLARGDEWRALWRSTWIALASVALAALFGIPLAFVFERTEFPGRRILGALLALPVALPPLVGVIAFLFLWGESGIVARLLRAVGFDVSWRFTGALAILVVHAYSMYVYFYLFTRAALSKIDVAMIEAAASLGAGRLAHLENGRAPAAASGVRRRLAAGVHDGSCFFFSALHLRRRLSGDDDPDRFLQAQWPTGDGTGRDGHVDDPGGHRPVVVLEDRSGRPR